MIPSLRLWDLELGEEVRPFEEDDEWVVRELVPSLFVGNTWIHTFQVTVGIFDHHIRILDSKWKKGKRGRTVAPDRRR